MPRIDGKKPRRLNLKQHLPFKNIPGIYKIICTKNGRVYIGSSVKVKERIYKHFSSLKDGHNSNHYLQEDYNKYGETCFGVILMEYSDDMSNCDRLERERRMIINYPSHSLYNGMDFSGKRPRKEWLSAIAKLTKGKVTPNDFI